MNIHKVDSVKVKAHDSSKDSVWREVVIKGEDFTFRLVLHARNGQKVLAVHETNEHDCCFMKDEA